MDKKTEKLFNSIVKEYVRTAEPVGSKLLVDKYNLGISSATARNKMADLERDGYIYQPYTSAGRMPSEKGYEFYVSNCLKEKKLKDNDKKTLQKIVKRQGQEKDDQKVIKDLTKQAAELSGQLMFIAFAPNQSYYTGIANIFSQPEFSQGRMTYDISLVVDHLDDILSKLFFKVSAEPEIMIGKNNPFGEMCSAIVTSYGRNQEQGILGLLGPTRMDYDNNWSLINYLKELINKEN